MMGNTYISMVPVPTPPTFPPVEMVYDDIMHAIDPRLTSGEIKLLHNRYDELSKEQKETILKQFAHAFVTFDKQYDEYIRNFRIHVDSYRKEVRVWAEGKSDHIDEKKLQQIEVAIFSGPETQLQSPVTKNEQ